MPRKEQLKNVQQNRYYTIEATLKYSHITQNKTTAIIEDGETQSKIIIPTLIGMNQNSQMRFNQCFVSQNGWLQARKPLNKQVYEYLGIQSPTYLTLNDIVNKKETLSKKYFSFCARVLAVEPTKCIKKQTKNLHLTILKCYAQNYFIDVSLWNNNNVILPGVYFFEAFRIKNFTQQSFVLTSGVYSKIITHSDQTQFQFMGAIGCKNLSTVYQLKSTMDLKKQIENVDLQGFKCYSQIQCIFVQANQQHYLGCANCQKKRNEEETLCQCGNTAVGLYSIFRVTFTDISEEYIQAISFNENIRNIIAAYSGEIVKIKIQSIAKFTPVYGWNVSHIITSIN